MTTYLKGVEVPLPEGETLLWQGSPAFRSLAVHAFHARKIALYFLGLIVITAVVNRGASVPGGLLASSVPLAIGGATAVAFAVTVAQLAARTTLYAITDRRVVMKVGIALPIVLNIPLRMIESVDMKQYAGGLGNLSLKIAGGNRVAYAVLWPHARPWRVRFPEPLLRDLPNVSTVGATLREALLSAATAPSESLTITSATAPAAAASSAAASSAAAASAAAASASQALVPATT